MSLRLYNTLSGAKEPFEPVAPGKVGMYLCGPTVYKPPHIGHMVGPVIFDAIKRYLTFRGFAVTWITNITDVDDKLIEAAAKANTTVTAMAEKYTAAYMECLARLGIDTIDRFPKASEHIGEIIAICETLIAKRLAYEVEGNVWFDVTRDADYGKLSHRSVQEQEAGLRTLEGAGKRHPADFALWKAAKPGEISWDSPWGKGRPGWHIECTAMSTKYLGPTFDIHGGGLDLMFPHHENELAQSESYSGKPFVKYWLHNGLTKVRTKSSSGEWKSQDMHASTGNVISAKELIDKHGPELFRYMLLSTHYRSPIDFSDEVLTAAGKGLQTFVRLGERIARLVGTEVADASELAADSAFAKDILAKREKFIDRMDDDFNTGSAIGVLHEMASAINAHIEQSKVEVQKQPEIIREVSAATGNLKQLANTIGLFRTGFAATAGGSNSDDLDKLMKLFIELRNQARASKNFALADGIRNGLKGIGFSLEDRASETQWRKES